MSLFLVLFGAQIDILFQTKIPCEQVGCQDFRAIRDSLKVAQETVSDLADQLAATTLLTPDQKNEVRHAAGVQRDDLVASLKAMPTERQTVIDRLKIEPAWTLTQACKYSYLFNSYPSFHLAWKTRL